MPVPLPSRAQDPGDRERPHGPDADRRHETKDQPARDEGRQRASRQQPAALPGAGVPPLAPGSQDDVDERGGSRGEPRSAAADDRGGLAGETRAANRAQRAGRKPEHKQPRHAAAPTSSSRAASSPPPGGRHNGLPRRSR